MTDPFLLFQVLPLSPCSHSDADSAALTAELESRIKELEEEMAVIKEEAESLLHEIEVRWGLKF